MNKLGLPTCGLVVALSLLGACANDALVGAQDEHEDDGGDADGDADMSGDGDGTPDGDDDDQPFECPEAPPTEDAPCSDEGASCEYDECIEPISKATCTDGRWLTEADGCPSPFEETCPDSPPAEGDPCSPDAVSLGCTYDCATGLPADHGLEAHCTNIGVFELNDDACRLCGGVANPAGCSDDNPCAAGFTCLPPPPPGGGEEWECTSSGCLCDPDTNTWSCLPDCGGSHCIPDEEVACAGTINPEGCSDTHPCPGSLTCQAPLEPVCLSSSCTCNAEGGWDCTEDCSGGECR